VATLAERGRWINTNVEKTSAAATRGAGANQVRRRRLTWRHARSNMGAELPMVEVAPRIVVDERVRFGRPVIAGTRVPVDVVVGKLGAGMSVDEVADEYGIEAEDVRAALRYAATVVEGEQVRAVS
jgi:uncharacterized protein (DUF433 family)